MNEDARRSDGACANDNNFSTVDQALRGEIQTLRIEPDQNFEIGPDSSYGRTVRLESFQDLQGLGFVPRAAKEDAVASANTIIAKAREAAELEKEQLMSQLKREFGRMVADATSRVTGKVLNSDDQGRINQETAAQVSA